MDVSHDPTPETPNSPAPGARKRALRPGVVFGGLLVLCVLAWGAVAGARGPFGFGGHGRFADPELARDHAAFMVERMLNRLEATPEQIDQVETIVDAAIEDLFRLREAGAEARGEFLAVLTAEEIDREALEGLRQEKLRSFDVASQRIVQAVADVGEVLTPVQRATLAERIAERRARWHGGWPR